MRGRSRARAWALQVLYAWDLRRPAGPPSAVLSEFVRERRIAHESRGYLEHLVRLFEQRHEEIDHALQDALTNWRLERLAAIDRNILRIAAAEMLHGTDVPPAVSIQEAILLAERYGTAESPRFVNGVLDALLRRARSEALGRRAGERP